MYGFVHICLVRSNGVATARNNDDNDENDEDKEDDCY